jgi:hypothetical protein
MIPRSGAARQPARHRISLTPIHASGKRDDDEAPERVCLDRRHLNAAAPDRREADQDSSGTPRNGRAKQTNAARMRSPGFETWKQAAQIRANEEAVYRIPRSVCAVPVPGWRYAAAGDRGPQDASAVQDEIAFGPASPSAAWRPEEAPAPAGVPLAPGEPRATHAAPAGPWAHALHPRGVMRSRLPSRSPEFLTHATARRAMGAAGSRHRAAVSPLRRRHRERPRIDQPLAHEPVQGDPMRRSDEKHRR